METVPWSYCNNFVGKYFIVCLSSTKTTKTLLSLESYQLYSTTNSGKWPQTLTFQHEVTEIDRSVEHLKPPPAHWEDAYHSN